MTTSRAADTRKAGVWRLLQAAQSELFKLSGQFKAIFYLNSGVQHQPNNRELFRFVGTGSGHRRRQTGLLRTMFAAGLLVFLYPPW
jgi:hypothetical protein